MDQRMYSHVGKMADKKKNGSSFTKQKQIKQNTKLILEDISNANLLVDILDISESKEEGILLDFIKSVHKIFTSFWKDKKLVQNKSNFPTENIDEKAQQDDPEEVFGMWLYEKYSVVLNKLLKLLHDESNTVQELALCTLMKFVVAQQAGLSQDRSLFPVALYEKILDELIHGNYDMSSLIERFGEFLEYDDIRFYTLKFLSQTLKEDTATQSIKCFINNVYSLLNMVKFPVKQDEMENFLVVKNHKEGKEKRAGVFNLKLHKKHFSKAWLGFLNKPLSSEMHKKVLLNLHTNVIPFMSDPKMLMDFLTDAYNAGGAISLLALNGLFILIHQHNLDYPDFFKKLYALLEPGIFHVKYQSRFFHLLDLFLTSTHLPAYLVAAFCKRLAQLALSAPPQGVMLAVMFVKNLLKRHPSCQVLIHRKEVSKLLLNGSEDQPSDNSNADSSNKLPDPNNDPYDPNEPDPAKCHALQSSLWELKTLEHHFYPRLPSLIEAFEKPLDKVEVDISKYFDVGYDGLFDKHCVKVTEENAVLEYQVPKGILGTELSEFWTLDA